MKRVPFLQTGPLAKQSDPIRTVESYHEASKHHFDRYARSVGYLDWATQPNPFRRFSGTDLTQLPLSEPDRTTSYDDLFRLNSVPAEPVSLSSIGAFCKNSLAITAWKSDGANAWALRVNPSSGNLHPTEGYLVIGRAPGLDGAPAVYHYCPKEHGLELRNAFSEEQWRRLMASFPVGSFLIGLSSIHWREAWKYGERAYRYCQHDIGHALAGMRFAAAALGWSLSVLDGIGDAAVARLLGLDRNEDFIETEREEPALLAVVAPSQAWKSGVDRPETLPSRAIQSIAESGFLGTAESLSSDHVRWDIIETVSRAGAKPETKAAAIVASRPRNAGPPIRRQGSPAAADIFRRRRSAVRMDGRTSISRDVFYAMLSRATPARSSLPWDAVAWNAAIHLVLFVHRVDGLPAGLYCLARAPDAVESLRAAMDAPFVWEVPESCPAGLNLFLLEAGDGQRAAAQISCFQDIAGDGAFSLGMLAEWKGRLAREGPWFYRRLFWEAGMIGQVLYLEAEATGVGATGIGCFFDDAVHDLLRIRNREYQSVYHFTVGGPVEDRRLTTLPPYPESTGAMQC